MCFDLVAASFANASRTALSPFARTVPRPTEDFQGHAFSAVACARRVAGPDLDHRRQPQPMAYGRVYGMQKTTVYLPTELKTSLRCMARATGISEAELIRQAIGEKVLRHPHPRPRVPLTDRGLGDPEAAHRVDELLAGIGSR